ncbi:MAG: XkdW family protein [Methanotrichaceae archaeon]|nr:XkdW family protein [Methanotrichaceae archaeon]
MRNQCFSIILCTLAFISVLPAQGGEVSINTLQYLASPETLAIGERVPIVVGINYANLAQSTLNLHLAYADYPPRFQSGGEVTVSGSGTYLFPPAEIMVPASYSIPSGWPEYINEWHLRAEIWKEDELLAGRAFTLLVENPEYKPEVEIDNIESSSRQTRLL